MSQFKTLILSILFLLPLSTFGQSQEIVGTWFAEDETGEEGTFTFDKNGFAYLTLEGETMGGPSYIMNDEEYALGYVIKESKSFYKIDFVIFSKSEEAVVETMKGIFKLSQDNKKMLICLNFGIGERPDSFEDEDTMELIKEE